MRILILLAYIHLERVSEGLLALNICLLIPLLTSIANGLDSSLVNGNLARDIRIFTPDKHDPPGLQLLPAWKLYFNHPSGRWLGTVSPTLDLLVLTVL